MKVDVCASHVHYVAHLLPIYNALPDEMKGEVFAPHGRPPRRRDDNRLTLVAGRVDVAWMTPYPVVLVEHGAGQTYAGHDSLHNVGSCQPRHVIAYIGPGLAATDLWDAANPGRPSAAVGCPRIAALQRSRPKPDPHTVAIAFRWNAPIGERIPEQRPALEHYINRLGAIILKWQSEGWTVLGHGHPRARRELNTMWRTFGIRPTWDVDEVLTRASTLVMDNSSIMYEAAAMERTVISLNAPWYRRDVEHGLRFWSHIPGRSVDSPAELLDFDIGYTDFDAAQKRSAAARYVYAHCDGSSADRAAAFVAGLK